MAPQKKSEHKNATRSRHLIKQAFAELLNEKDISKITVTDIVDRANISRGTFYAHYIDIYDLYGAIQHNIIEAVDENIDRIGMENIIREPHDAFYLAINFLSKNKSYYKLFITSDHAEALITRIVDRLSDKIYTIILAECPVEDAQKIRTFMLYTTGAIKNVMLAWLKGSLELTVDECTDYLVEMYMSSRPLELIRILAANDATVSE